MYIRILKFYKTSNEHEDIQDNYNGAIKTETNPK